MCKTTFRYDLHKELWDIITSNPGLTKEQAFDILKACHTELIDRPDYICFACDANHARIGSHKLCETFSCPLYWRTSGHIPNENIGCMYDIKDRRTGLFALWEDAMREGNEDACAKLAAMIRNLPIASHAYKFYDIVSNAQ